MVTCSCDQCGAIINRDGDAWYGLDHTLPLKPFDEFDDGETQLLTLPAVGEHQHHLCSAGCLAAWALDQAVG